MTNKRRDGPSNNKKKYDVPTLKWLYQFPDIFNYSIYLLNN
jgi:hypothetical protein